MSNYKTENIDYDALAITIIDAFKDDRLKSGRSEIVSGMEYILNKSQNSVIEERK